LDSTGSARRALLKAAALAPLWAAAARAEAREYGSAAEVFDTIDGLEADVAARLREVRLALASSAAFAASVLADHARHRAARARFRRRLRLAPSSTASARSDPGAPDLEGLRAAQEALVYSHAEGLPAVADPFVVDALAHHMVDLSRHLAVIQMWMEAET
jgi:hypothetical protein